MTTLTTQAEARIDADLATLKPFLNRWQERALIRGLSGEEREFFVEMIAEMAERVRRMPVTYEQDGKGDAAIAYLHYFHGSGCHWYITEKDVEDGVSQAFGFAVLNGDMMRAEYGYVSIEELVACDAELDLFYGPVPMSQVKATLHRRYG